VRSARISAAASPWLTRPLRTLSTSARACASRSANTCSAVSMLLAAGESPNRRSSISKPSCEYFGASRPTLSSHVLCSLCALTINACACAKGVSPPGITVWRSATACSAVRPLTALSRNCGLRPRARLAEAPARPNAEGLSFPAAARTRRLDWVPPCAGSLGRVLRAVRNLQPYPLGWGCRHSRI
jgi:hypothetical protein